MKSDPKKRARNFLDDKVEQVRPLNIEAADTYWEFAQTGEEELGEKAAELRDEIDQYYLDEEELEQVESFLEDQDVRNDNLLRRRLELMRKGYLSRQGDPELLSKINHLSTDVAGKYNRFRGEVDGEEVNSNEIQQVLRESTESEEVRAYWEAQKQVGPAVEEQLLELIEARNELAGQLGFDDYFQMNVTLSELDPDKLESTMGELEQSSREPYDEFKADLDTRLAERFGVAEHELRPWHYGNPWYQDVPPAFETDLDPLFEDADIEALTAETFSNMGMEVQDMLDKSSLYEEEGKAPSAFCIDVDRAGDIRVHANIRPNESWMSTMLHEFGHAVYDKYIDRDLPWDLRTASHSNATEAIAIFCQQLTHDPSWLADYTPADSDEVERIADDVARELRAEKLIFTRWGQVMYHFESQLYADPSQDLDKLWWDLKREHQGLEVDAAREQHPDWASKLHIVRSPAMYHNYSYGYMIAAQLRDFAASELGVERVDSPEVGEFLINDYFAPGKALRWDDLLDDALGEGLEPEYYVREMTA